MSVFEPDILIGAAPRTPGSAAAAERRLLAAILTDALECFQKNVLASTPKRQRLFREAERWILSDDLEWVFSFRNVCDCLGVDPSALRRRARLWRVHQMRVAMPDHHFGATG